MRGYLVKIPFSGVCEVWTPAESEEEAAVLGLKKFLSIYQRSFADIITSVPSVALHNHEDEPPFISLREWQRRQRSQEPEGDSHGLNIEIEL